MYAVSRVMGRLHVRRICTRPPAPRDRPDEATVRQLAESAKFQQKMWSTFVPEAGIKFGDRRV